MSSFDCEKFSRQLKTRSFGRVLHYHPSLDSTNRLLKELALAGEAQGSVILADLQTQGRGRWGRTWEGAAEKGLLFSLLLRPPAGQILSQLTAVMGVAEMDVISRLAPNARLKWPNDVWVDSRKLSGLLLESAGEAMVVGLGLNVNQDVDDFSPGLEALSLKQLCGLSVEREALLADLLLAMEQRSTQWLNDGFAVIRRAWDEKACFIGEMVQAGAIQGRALGLDEAGGLLIEQDGKVKSLLSGDVSKLRPA